MAPLQLVVNIDLFDAMLPLLVCGGILLWSARLIRSVRHRHSIRRGLMEEMDVEEAMETITNSRGFRDRSTVYPPVREESVREAERQLGFPFHQLLRSLLTGVANGGFGPGYGLLGLEGGRLTDEGNTSIELYLALSRPDPEDPEWTWPAGLLPLCHWGCAIYSCVDCTTPEGQIIWFDPNAYDSEETREMAFRAQGIGIVEFMVGWSQGKNHWAAMYGEDPV